MNRRAVLLAVLAALPASARLAPVSAKPRRAGRRQPAARGKPAGTKAAARRQPGGSLTASHARFRIVTRTFTSNVPINIPVSLPASPYPATLLVGGLTQGRILKVRVALIGINHTFPGDLDIMVVAPGNKGVILMSDAGGNDDLVGTTLIFDQQVPTRLPSTAITSGTYQPANDLIALDPYPAPAPAGVTGHSLTAFNNRNPNGIWRLYIVDDTPALDGGTLGGWSLTIRARIRVPHRHGRRSNQRQRPVRRAKT